MRFGSGCQMALATALNMSRPQSPRRLPRSVADMSAERLRQKKELDLVLGERDILGTQLIRRNDELALLYEKVKIQQSTLSRGQIQYRDR